MTRLLHVPLVACLAAAAFFFVLSCGGGGGTGSPAGDPTPAGSQPGELDGGLGLPGGAGEGSTDSGSEPPAQLTFLEPPPTQTELSERATSLLAAAEVRVDAATREVIEQVVVLRAGPARRAADDSTGVLGEAWAAAAVDAFLSGAQDTALWCILRGHEEAPSDPYVLSQLGFLLLYRGDTELAKGFLLRAYELAPDFAPVLFCLGFVYEQDGEPERASYFYRKLAATHPENPYFGYPLARSLAAAGQEAAARAALEPVAPALQGIPEVQELLERLPPVPEGSEDPGAAPSVPAGAGGQIGLSAVAAGFAACAQELLQDPYAQDVGDAGRAMDRADQETQARFQDSSWTAGECVGGCIERYGLSTVAEACEADCYLAQCERDAATAHEGSDAYVDAYARWVGLFMQMVGNKQACLMGVYYRNRSVLSPRDRDAVLSTIWNLLTEDDAGRYRVWEDVVFTVEAYREDAAASCQSAQQALADWDPYDLLFGHPADQGEMCGPGACIRWNGPRVELDGGVGPYSLQISGSYFDGFTGTFGREIWSRGPASVGVFVRFDSVRNTSGVELQGKVTGPVTGLELERRVALTPY